MKILITGASGNVGKATLAALEQLKSETLQVLAATRHKDKTKESDPFEPVYFDFAQPESYLDHLHQYDSILLLRPPQLADSEKYFKPFTDALQPNQHVVFLSVQGAEKMSWVPHHKIENLLQHCQASYTFLRPAYFMQNFEGDLHEDLVKRHQIFLPAGKSKFNLIDVKDIGKVAAHVLANPAVHQQQAYELTGKENLTFAEMAEIITRITGVTIDYQSPNVIKFYFNKKRHGIPHGKILVMIMLHFLPRLSKGEPQVSQWVKKITGKEPESFENYVARELNNILPLEKK